MKDLTDAQFVVTLTSQCDLRCAHCCSESGPDRREHLTLDRARSALALAVRLGYRSCLISGGEPLLHPEEVVHLVRTGNAEGLSMCLVTNANWAVSRSLAMARATVLKLAGLRMLTVSVDGFHLAQVPLMRILNVLDACRAVGLARRAAPTAIPGEASDSLWAVQRIRDAGHPTYDAQPVLPLGRARRMIDVGPEVLGKTACAIAQNAIVDADGCVYTCCAAPGLRAENRPALMAGNIQEDTVETLAERLDTPVTALLRAFGPLLLMEWCAQRNGLQPPGPFSFICDACVALQSEVWRDSFHRFAHSADGRQRLTYHAHAKALAKAAATRRCGHV